MDQHEKDLTPRQTSKPVALTAIAALAASVGMGMPAEAAIQKVEGQINSLRSASADQLDGQIMVAVASQVSDVALADYTESYTQTYTQTYNQTYGQRIQQL